MLWLTIVIIVIRVWLKAPLERKRIKWKGTFGTCLISLFSQIAFWMSNFLHGITINIIIALWCVTHGKWIRFKFEKKSANNSNCSRVTCTTLTEHTKCKQINRKKNAWRMSNIDRHNIPYSFFRTHAMCDSFVPFRSCMNLFTQSRAHRSVHLIEIQNLHIYFFYKFYMKSKGALNNLMQSSRRTHTHFLLESTNQTKWSKRRNSFIWLLLNRTRKKHTRTHCISRENERWIDRSNTYIV